MPFLNWGRPSDSPPNAAGTSKYSPLITAVAISQIAAAVRLPCMTTSSTDAVPPKDVAAGAAPTPHATAEQVEAARHDSKLAQVLYHDWEAETYDEKWSISYDQRCIDYARDCFDAIDPEEVL